MPVVKGESQWTTRRMRSRPQRTYISGLADPGRSPCNHTPAATVTGDGPVEGGTWSASEIWTGGCEAFMT